MIQIQVFFIKKPNYFKKIFDFVFFLYIYNKAVFLRHIMILTEKHIINNKHSLYDECDNLCFKSKNLYNQGLYNVRQFFFENNKYLSYGENYHIAKLQESYKELPAKVSCQILKLVDQNFKSFFGLVKTEGFSAKIPKYLDKVEGRYLTKYPKQALGLGHFKKTGELKLSQSNIAIKTKITDWESIKEVRIVHRNNFYVIEVVYEKKEKICNGNTIASIDPGLNNLATVTLNNGNQPFIINGKPLKSINQYYNKKKAKLQSELELKQKRKTSKRIQKLTFKRNNKINDYLHKASTILVNQLVLNNVGTLIIGKNTNQKQDSNMGKKNNQNFVNIPIFRFLNMVSYKAKLEGIEIQWQEESYTSKASFLSLDFIPNYGDKYIPEFNGYRQHRGLYKIKNKKMYINADVNGSYNIMRKAIPKVFANGIEGFGVNPVKFNI